MERVIKCDKDGVPKVVQGIEYNEKDDTVDVLFFNGMTRTFPGRSLICRPTSDVPCAWAEGLESAIERLVPSLWHLWFPPQKNKGVYSGSEEKEVQRTDGVLAGV